MSQIPGVNVSNNTVEASKPKSMVASKTVWAIVLAAGVKVVTELIPSLKEAITPDVVNAVVTIFAAAAAIFHRKSVEDAKVTSVTGVIKK